MIDSRYRKTFQPAFDALGGAVKKSKITPNQITVLAFLIGISSGVLVAFEHYILAIIALAISGILDVLDGTVARLTGKSSPFGAFLDMVLDRLVEGAVVIGFYFAFPQFSLFYLLFFISVVFNFATFTVAGALIKNQGAKSMHYDPGIAERTETFITFWLMMLFPAVSGYILLTFTGVIFLTGIIRFINISRIMRRTYEKA